jgi:hypothetical protein
VNLEMVDTGFVEKALIGSILNDPDRRADVPWLTAADFTNPLCRAVWAHLETDNSPGGAPGLDLVALSQALGVPGGLHPTLRSPSALAELLLDAPLRPAIPDYGRVLVEMATRREITAMGLRLESRAKDEPERILAESANTIAAVNRLDRRWRATRDERARPVEAGSDTPAPAAPPPDPGPATGPFATWTPCEGIDQQMAHKAVLGAVVYDCPRGVRGHLLATITVDDFTHAPCAATWRAVNTLAAAGTAIDEITVAWQALRQQSRQGAGLTCSELRELQPAAPLHASGATRLLRTSLGHITHNTHSAATRAAADLTADLGSVLATTSNAATRVAVSAQRLSAPRA